ncbi:D-glycero-alpha-D-manno-heptose-1,7-bisphosphate 7-phosphatase [Paenibacillus thalictri]|uniref:D,D-heptose 1,7-bisphosphate phosphatase n=1 Tax=Paenibacillus thalictri TaxID=2527873 RepID=A0A4V2J4Y9_9BACL|nr:HAD family hydrolase [Paenibacillus thalictri]TBL81752.1 HAD family hydrolase [Paenibacillus thalictri]
MINATAAGSKAVFLDRDGIINVEKHYCYRINDFEFTDGIFEALRYMQSLRYKLVVVTNQAGIGRGYYTEADFMRVTRFMLDRLGREGIRMDRVYYSPFHPVHGIGYYRKNSPCRKPNPGMIVQAAQELHIDLSASMMVGDKETDIEAGIRAGIPVNVLVTNEAAAAAQSKASVIVPQVKDLLAVFKAMTASGA